MTSHHTGASHGIAGSLRAVDGKAVVRMEDVFDTGIDDLWSALTDPRRPRLAFALLAVRLAGDAAGTRDPGWPGWPRRRPC
jgi:hypothetical protein